MQKHSSIRTASCVLALKALVARSVNPPPASRRGRSRLQPLVLIYCAYGLDGNSTMHYIPQLSSPLSC